MVNHYIAILRLKKIGTEQIQSKISKFNPNSTFELRYEIEKQSFMYAYPKK
jgi:hypothetical protein